MPTILRSTGIVLRSIRHGETSLVLTVFTRDFGKIGLMAKGARSKSRLGSAAGLELLCEAEFVFYHKPGRDLQLLKEWSVSAAHTGLRSSFEVLAVASAVAELLLRCLRDEDAHANLYEHAASVLSALELHPAASLPLLWVFELQLFRSLGFGLQFERCAQTGKPLEPPFSAGVRYRLSEGSFLHPGLPRGAANDGELSAESFALLATLASSSLHLAGRIAPSSRTQQELTSFLARYLETHLPVRGRLRSLEALRWSSSDTQSEPG